LIKLETQMEAYLGEIDLLLVDVKGLDT